MFHISCILTLPAFIIILPDKINCTDSIDDISLSENINTTLDILPEEVRSIVERMAKENKYFKGRLDYIEPTHGYYSFRCAVDEIKSKAFMIFPQFYSKEDRLAFIQGIENEIPLPKDVQNAITLFKNTEIRFQVLPEHRGTIKIPLFFDTMFAFLTRCSDDYYNTILSSVDLKTALKIRKKLFHFYGVNEYDDEVKLISIIVQFCSSYARSRHASDGIHHVYALRINDMTRILRKKMKREVHLAEVLDFMGILEAWNFTKEDLNHINIIRQVLKPPLRNPPFLSTSYKIGNIAKGILPYLRIENCPRLKLTQ